MNTNHKSDRKCFVIDTNVFIHRPDAINSFRDNEVVIPLFVLEELDDLKSAGGEKGRNARSAIRLLDHYGSRGSLSEGVMMDNGSLLKVELTYKKDIHFDINTDRPDNKILLVAYTLQQQGKRVFFVSKDINARVKATALGLKAVDYKKQTVDINTLYSGLKEIDGSDQIVEALHERGEVEWKEHLFPNQYVLFRRSKEEPLLARYDHKKGVLRYRAQRRRATWGIKPRNVQQQMAMELLLDDSIPLVTLVGKAGTGKTLLAIAAGLKKVHGADKYERVLVSRPIVPMGKDIGYLPGAKEEKLKNWMQPLFDNLEYIISSYKKENITSTEELLTENIIEIEALTYIRGRSLPHQFIIVDEAQNLSPHEVKTIVSRAGEGSKVVLTGDPFQIDSPYLDSNSNGLSYLVETFKGQECFGHVTLEKSERSFLAELAAELL
ncbi:MAG: PhoH family protein [Spirochaetales bacterium]|nr:PhoH family protein [Spirochaetales bacterium]